jgi:hypothetical protein
MGSLRGEVTEMTPGVLSSSGVCLAEGKCATNWNGADERCGEGRYEHVKLERIRTGTASGGSSSAMSGNGTRTFSISEKRTWVAVPIHSLSRSCLPYRSCTNLSWSWLLTQLMKTGAFSFLLRNRRISSAWLLLEAPGALGRW